MAEIKPEVTFDINNFGKQNTLTQAQTIAQMLVNLFLMTPGQMPSLPHIGINIQQYLYKFDEDINEAVIRNKIADQCPDILSYIDANNMQIITVPTKDDNILFLYVPLRVSGDDTNALVMGVKKSNGSSDIGLNYRVQPILDN